MSIEFRCTQCGKLLRTNDDTAGKQAKCPECGQLVTVPSPAAPAAPVAARAAASPPAAPVPRVETGNPYQAPAVIEAHEEGGFRPVQLDLGDVLGRTWRIYKQAVWPCLGVVLFVYFVSNAPQFLVQAGVIQDSTVALVLFAVTWIVSVWLGIGQAVYLLKVARGDPRSFGDVFSGGRYILPVLGAAILFGLMMIGGFILLIVPGVIVSLMFSQFYYLIIDKHLGVFDSLQRSREIMAGNKAMLFAIYLVTMLIVFGVMLVTCFVGLIFAAPYFVLMPAVIYLVLTGQPTADQKV